MGKYRIRAILILAALAASTAEVLGCSCADPSVRQKFRSADVVFVGRLAEKRYLQGSEFADSVKFKIEKRWKGDARKEINVLFQFDIPGMCGDLPLTEGERYLIYAYRRKEGLVTYIDCGPNRMGQRATAEIKKLGDFWFRTFARLFPFPKF